jgi:hypothetical protein
MTVRALLYIAVRYMKLTFDHRAIMARNSIGVPVVALVSVSDSFYAPIANHVMC